jgi:hypothetical protein
LYCIYLFNEYRVFFTTEHANGVIPNFRYVLFASPKSGVPTYINGTGYIGLYVQKFPW